MTRQGNYILVLHVFCGSAVLTFYANLQPLLLCSWTNRLAEILAAVSGGQWLPEVQHAYTTWDFPAEYQSMAPHTHIPRTLWLALIPEKQNNQFRWAFLPNLFKRIFPSVICQPFSAFAILFHYQLQMKTELRERQLSLLIANSNFIKPIKVECVR